MTVPWTHLAVLTGAYVLAGKLGLSFASVHASASPVWPPAGIALASFLLLGNGVWPAILLGAFIVNVTTAGSVATSLGIACGNTLEGWLGGWLVSRYARGPYALDRAPDVFRFVVLAGLVATAVSATIGVSSLALGGYAQWQGVGAIWATWWLGDAAGVLVVAPLVLLWGRARDLGPVARRPFEAGLLLLVVLAVGELLFGGVAAVSPGHYPLAFLAIPPLLWAAFRFGPREAATMVALLAAVAIRGTLLNGGMFAARGTPNTSLLLLQGFMGTMAATVLAVAAVVRDRKSAEEERAALLTREQTARTESDERRRESDVIAALAAEINRSLEPDRVLQQVAEAATALCGADFARIALGEPGTDAMTFRFTVGARVSMEEYRHVHIEPGRGLGGQVISSGRPYRTPDMAQDPQRLATLQWLIDAEGGRSLMIVPIVSEGQVGGLIYVHRRSVRPFSDRDEIVGLRLADQAAIAIRNSHLFAAERAARSDAHAANRAKDHFLATLSHELRTPLNAMIGWLRMLRTPALDEARRAHALEVIERNARLQAQLINDLLDVSRIIAGKVELERYPVELVPVIQEAIDAVRRDVEAKSLALTVDLDPATGAIHGDPGRLQQVVTNLLSNAVKFTSAGGRIDVRLTRAADRARLTIEDTGEGIAADVLPYVFEPFRQADSSTTRAHQGLGLGLAIVRQIVELHGGLVQARSGGPGCGAAFTVTLPLIATRLVRARERLATGSRTRLDGLRVLVVDDEADSREVVALSLREAGAEVATADSATRALELIGLEPIDVLVSDLAMPGADGYDLIAAVRASETERSSAIRAVALTAYAGDDVRERAMAAGFTAHATKPFDPQELVDLIAKLSRG